MVWYGVRPSVCPVVCLNRYRLLQQHATGSLLWARWQGGSGAGTWWNTVPANILEPEWRSSKYRWPQVER